MILLNYSHPLTETQLDDVQTQLGQLPTVRDISVQIDRATPFADVARDLADASGLSSIEWQGSPLIINPPGLAPLALALIAEVHGRCGYFPPILNIRPAPDALPPRYELAEIVSLQDIRERARMRR